MSKVVSPATAGQRYVPAPLAGVLPRRRQQRGRRLRFIPLSPDYSLPVPGKPFMWPEAGQASRRTFRRAGESLVSCEVETDQVNTSSYGRVVSAALLTRALKQLRQASGQQRKQVAEALGWPVSKLIRIEGSTVRITRTDQEALLRHYGLSDPAQVDELAAWAREARVSGWWEGFRIQDKAFERYVGYEAGAASIRMVQELLVPGILQTEEYARLITGTYAAREDADSIVQLRLERQEQVSGRIPEQHYILDEAVLRRRVGDAMPRQLRHLLEIAARPEVTIRVIPFGAGPHFGMKGPFVLLGFDVPLGNVLFLESGRRGDLIICEEETYSDQRLPGLSEAAEIIASFEDGFSQLSQIALDEAQSAALIDRIARESALLLLSYSVDDIPVPAASAVARIRAVAASSRRQVVRRRSRARAYSAPSIWARTPGRRDTAAGRPLDPAATFWTRLHRWRVAPSAVMRRASARGGGEHVLERQRHDPVVVRRGRPAAGNLRAARGCRRRPGGRRSP